jgi:hypothetical protein
MTGCAISPAAFAALAAPRAVADATPVMAPVTVFASASNPPAAVPRAAPTVSAAFANVLSFPVLWSSCEFAMFAPSRVRAVAAS